MRDSNGRWYPRLAPKQVEVFNDTHQRVLLSGPRWCGKSIVALHKIIKHAWMYPNDRVGIFVKSTKIGKTGVWDDLVSYALPEWVEGLADEGFKIIRQGQDGTTRMHYVVIANQHGGESEIQLHPLHHQDSVAEKMKGSRFGALLFDEIDNYDNPDVFKISVLQLRQIGLANDKHLWLATCNPAGDESHWLYQKFWIDCNDPARDPIYRAMFRTFEFKLYDNPFVEEAKWQELRETYKDDPEMYQRYVEGKWVPDHRNIHFAGAFRAAYHIRGNALEKSGLVPSETCAELLVGWDIGDRNSAVVFLEKVLSGAGYYFTVLDEVSHLKEDISIQVLVAEVMSKMEELRSLCPNNKVKFIHWSDRSAFDRYRSAADARDHILVNQFSDGAITLVGCPKPPGSVQARISLTRQLLIGERLFVSATVPGIIDMFKKLTRGKTKGELIRRDDYIHRFDAMSYALYGESIHEIEDNMRPKLGSRASEGFSVAR